MKKQTFNLVIFSIILIPFFAFAQLKKDTKLPDFSDVLSQPANNYFLGMFDPSKFQMNHTFSASFGMGGGAQMLQNSYLNTMLFNLSENLTLRTDLGILQTPYHTFGESSSLNDPHFFGGAALEYRISKNAFLQLNFESLPYGTYNNSYYYNRMFYSPLNRSYYFDDHRN